MEKINIRKIVKSDIVQVTHFTDSLYMHYGDEEVSRIKNDILSLDGYIADNKSNCLGFILFSRINENTGKINWLVTFLNNLEKSVASMLLKRVEREFLKKRIQKIQVETKSDIIVSEKDLLLRQFYRLHDYKDKEIKSMEGTDKLILEKWLF